jgi:hypothetical protein
VEKHIMHYLKTKIMLILDHVLFYALQSYMGTISSHTGRILQTFKHKDGVTETAGDDSSDQMKSQLSNFLPTSRRIMQFSNGQV